jgi:outer membrane lipoprotein carrier protein
MKHFFILLIVSTISLASLDNIDSFQADFTQTVTDDKNKSLVYSGHILASKPQYALWDYKKPIQKFIYINESRITVIEPEIEQVIIRNIESNFDFFYMIKNSKKITKDRYEAVYKEARFIITTKNNLLKSISYVDEFENNVKIVFENQKQNEKLNLEVFSPVYPVEYDIIRD